MNKRMTTAFHWFPFLRLAFEQSGSCLGFREHSMSISMAEHFAQIGRKLLGARRRNKFKYCMAYLSHNLNKKKSTEENNENSIT